MAGIRVNTGIKRIEVNDSGDYITLSLSDNAFIKRFYSLYGNIQKKADDYTKRENAIREKYMGEENQNAILGETLALYSAAGDDMAAEVDKLFGEDTCKKVFGDIAPGFDLFLDFFEQLTPYLQEFSRERAQRMSKYSADRIGNA